MKSQMQNVLLFFLQRHCKRFNNIPVLFSQEDNAFIFYQRLNCVSMIFVNSKRAEEQQKVQIALFYFM